MRLVVKPSKGLRGTITVPPSKSHSLRAAIFATLATGTSNIANTLSSPDARACLRACRMFGAKIEEDEGWRITGTGGMLQTPEDVIDVANSGICLRFLSAMAAGCEGHTVITGDHSIRSNRVMQPLITAINDLGGWAASTRDNGYAPLVIRGPVQGGEIRIDGRDSQHISALMIASIAYAHPIEMHVENPGEKPWIDLTLSWLDRFSLSYKREGYDIYRLPGRQDLQAFDMKITGDFSSALFPIAAGLLCEGSDIMLHGLDEEDAQGDKKAIGILRSMGGDISWDDGLHVRAGPLAGQEIDVNGVIDALPILSVIGCKARGTTVLKNASIARTKESDRLAAMACELKKMGAKIEEREDTLHIMESDLRGAQVDAHHDHRVAMSLAIAGLIAKGETIINDAGCIEKTYGTFPAHIDALQGNIRVER